MSSGHISSFNPNSSENTARYEPAHLDLHCADPDETARYEPTDLDLRCVNAGATGVERIILGYHT